MSTFALPLLLSSLLLSHFSFAGDKKFTLDDLAPDQSYVGMAEVHEKADEILDQAKLSAKTRGTSVQDEVIKILNQKLQRDVRAYISPDGKVRIVDSHHKVMAAWELMRREKIPMKKVLFEANVEKDFSEKKWSQYVKYREKNDPTYIPKKIRSSLDEDGLVEFYKNLPEAFDGLKDSPMRSAVGKLFDTLSIKGSYFEPFIQFQLGERLEAMGVHVAAGEEFSAEVQQNLQRKIFEGGKTNPLYKFLQQSALPENKSIVSSDLAKGESSLSSYKLGEQSSEGAAGGVSGVCSESFAKLAAGDLRLPILEVPKDMKSFQRLLSTAQANFSLRVDLERLDQILKKLEKNAKLSKSDQSFLKEARKSSLTLRSALKLFGSSEASETADPFRRLVKKLGALNDELEDWDFEGKVPKSIRSDASDLRDLIKDRGQLKTQPVKTAEDFAKSQKDYLDWMNSLVNRQNMTVEEYHDLRKAVRDYRGLTELLASTDPKPSTKLILDYLAKLSKRMGTIKDGLLDGDHMMKDVLQSPTRLDDESKQELERFLNMMKDGKPSQ